MASGNIQAGSGVPFTAGQSVQLKNTSGVLLGILATVAGSVSLYDSSGAATQPIVTGLPLVAGWNPVPVTFGTGLYAVFTTSAGSAVIA